MIAATPLVQDPRPTLVGERVNSQGSRKAKELLLADDYDGLRDGRRGPGHGGAHVLDVCVALTERQDEDEQMRQVVKRIALTQPAPIQVDSTEPDVIETALEQIPGRAIVNSINLEAGRDKLDRVVPLAKAHGAALIALTIDEVGMAKTAERKLEIAQRITELCCDEHGLDREVADLRLPDVHADDRRRRVEAVSAIETIEGIRRVKSRDSGRQDLARRLERLASASACPRAACSTACSCTTASRPGSTWRWSTPTTSRRTRRSTGASASSPTTSSSTAARTRSSGSSPTSSPRARRGRRRSADPTEGMEPEEALHFHILRRKKEGVEDWIDRSVEKIGAVPTLNEVLLPAMKEVGDKFGAGELILPFVLQSAEVMKRAVAQLEQYLDKIEGYTKGTVVIATVFGDVHDIGKSLVNTILTNNGYTVVDLGKQVPISTILDAAVEHDATAIGLCALLVSTSKQMPACVQELHEREPGVPGADRRRRDQPQLRPADPVPERHRVRRGLRARRVLLQGRVRGAREDGPADRPRGARSAGREDPRGGAAAARAARRRSPTTRRRRPTPRSRRAASTDNPIPEPPFWGAREIEVDMDEVYRHLDTHVLFKLHWGGRGVKGEEWRRAASRERLPAPARADVARADLSPSARAARLLPVQLRRQRADRVGSGRARRARARAARVPAPAQARPDLPGRLLPPARDAGHPTWSRSRR